MTSIKGKAGYIAVLLVSIAGVVGILMLEPIAQDPAYHQFADQRTILGVPNFWNVVSNLPFLITGVMGLFSLYHAGGIKFLTEIKPAYILFFAGIALVCFGSAYYHLWPDNETLVWDRLPMALAFMALFAVIIG
ncbi:MAG: ceramidase, partial [Gammaproteobacteria bacterium]|nr:ceramidase [Gammaproteobacteria bacterium]